MTKKVLNIDVDPGQDVTLTASGSLDPDGDKLSYKWWIYREAGSYWADALIRGSNSVRAIVAVSKEASGRTIHVILEVVDADEPLLTAYRRVILNVSGDTSRHRLRSDLLQSI